MAVIKCPRCEINFMRDNEECCSVCMRELRREKHTRPEEGELCVECGLAPGITRDGLCAQCALELQSLTRDDSPSRATEDDDNRDDNGLDIISLELVDEDDDDDLLELELQMSDELDFSDEDMDELDMEEDTEEDLPSDMDAIMARHG